MDKEEKNFRKIYFYPEIFLVGECPENFFENLKNFNKRKMNESNDEKTLKQQKSVKYRHLNI